MLYSCFSLYSVPIHWLVHGHMTSNNETVPRQMLWAGNIAKNMTSNGKPWVPCYPRKVDRCCTWSKRWPDVVAGISARFSKFTFVLFCYITNHNLNIEIQSGNRVNCSPRDYNFSWTQYCLPLNTSDGITYEQTSYMSRSVVRLSANEKAKQMHLMINQYILRFRFTFYKTRQKAASKLTWVSGLS